MTAIEVALEPVARPGLVDEPGRHLSALEPLDCESEAQRFGRPD